MSPAVSSAQAGPILKATGTYENTQGLSTQKQSLTLAQRWQSFWCGLGYWWRSHASVAALLAHQRTYDEPAEVARTAIGALWKHRSNEHELTALEQAYLKRYPSLGSFRHRCSKTRYVETLTHLHFLELLSPAIPTLAADANAYTWLDVGAKNWSYVEALATLASNMPRLEMPCGWQLTGIELDAKRLYNNGFTRGAYGHSHAQTLDAPNTVACYKEGNAMGMTGRFHVISHFLPFVVPEPCLLWGLPLSHFQPQPLLLHLWQQLLPGGLMLIINQGRDEADAQAQLLSTLPDAAIEWQGRLPESFMHYDYPRFGWRIRKPEK